MYSADVPRGNGQFRYVQQVVNTSNIYLELAVTGHPTPSTLPSAERPIHVSNER